MCKIYTCKMCCVLILGFILMFRLDILIFTKLMVSNINRYFTKRLNLVNNVIFGLIKFGFELINQKIFEMIFFLNGPFCISCHLPFENDFFCQNINLPHICGHCSKIHPFVI